MQMIPIFIFSVLKCLSFLPGYGRGNIEKLCYASVHLQFSLGFMITTLFLPTSISSTSLSIGSHLNHTLDFSELCLRLAFGLWSDQKAGTRAITLVSKADNLCLKVVFCVRQRLFIYNNSKYISFDSLIITQSP